MKSLIRIFDLRPRRSRFNPRRSKAEENSLRAGSVAHGTSLVRAYQFVTQIEPASESLRRLFDLTRPATTHKRTFYFSVGTVLPQRQKCDASPFRERQFEIATFGITDKHFADERRLRIAIKKLSIAHLPITGWSGELVRGGRRAAR